MSLVMSKSNGKLEELNIDIIMILYIMDSGWEIKEMEQVDQIGEVVYYCKIDGSYYEGNWKND